MKSEFKNLLPKSARALVDDIERFCGFEIQVLQNPHPVSKTDPNPTGPASMIDEKSVTVFYRGRHNLIGSGLLHEILHLHRYSVEKIPQIMPTSNEENHWAITGQIENSLEHIVIISREADHGFDPYEHWNNTSRSNWSHDP